MTDYTPIITRLQGATGADRELDWLISDAFHEVPAHMVDVPVRYDWVRVRGAFEVVRYPGVGSSSLQVWKPFCRTASIDAALALVEGEWTFWSVESVRGRTEFRATLEKMVDGNPVTFNARAKTAPLAILVALFQALQEKEN